MTADPELTVKENMKKNPRLLTEDTSFKTGLVIVGGGSGTFYAIESLREVCHEKEISSGKRYILTFGDFSTDTKAPSLFCPRNPTHLLIGMCQCVIFDNETLLN